MNIIKLLKENPKSVAFTVSLVLTILSIVFKQNELISAVLALITSYTGLEVQNFYKGPVEKNNEISNEKESVDEEEGA